MTETPETDPVGEHDPTGTDYARRIARSARATGPTPTRTTRSSAPPKMTYDQGVVVVRTDSTAWATQLRTIAPQIVAKLNEAVGEGSVTFVEVRGPDAPTWRHGKLRVKGIGPRDTYG
jgi:predicted nucleic acid-binding Zn ribbon protein